MSNKISLKGGFTKEPKEEPMDELCTKERKMSETIGEATRRIATTHGCAVNDDEIDHAVWAHTGYPAFWTGEPRECFERQLNEYF